MSKFGRVMLGVTAVCLAASCAWGDSATDEARSAASQPLIPGVCPAEAGAPLAAVEAPVKSDPILIPAQKPSIAVPRSTDVVTTPAPSGVKPQKTLAPMVSSAPVPDAMKNPITLDQALEIAFRNSPAIQAALSQVEASRGVVDEARAAFNPTFVVQASSTFQGPVTKVQMAEGTMEMGSSPSSQASLTAALPLDVSHQLRYSSDIARYQFQVQYLSMVSVSEQLIVDVKSAYYDLLRACGQQAVAQAAVDDATARLANITAKREEGTAPQFDVTSAEVELENLNQELMAAENQVSIAQSALNGVLGVNVNNPTQVVSVDVSVTTTSVDIPTSVAEAYARRPELKAAQTAITLSETNVRLQKTGLLPSVSLSGNPVYNFNPSGFSSNNYSWSAGISLSVPIWDGGVTKAKVRQARADVKNSAAGLSTTKIAVATQVRNAALTLQNAALRTKTTARAVSLAEDALSIAMDRYDAGIAVLVEVTNAQTQLTQARFNYVNAQYDYAVALAQLQRATSSQPELSQLQLLADKGDAEKTGKEVRS